MSWQEEECVLEGRRNVSWQEGGMCPCQNKKYVKAGRKKSPGKKVKCILTGTRKCPCRKNDVACQKEGRYSVRKV
jgi:hypothetical protein